jgi:hypothetical protein
MPKGIYLRPSAESRFWSEVKKTLFGCWEWQASYNSGGYGHFYADGKEIAAHRFSWELHFGPIPEGMKVLHSCDNPKCVRPKHLFLGSYADNNKDRTQKGRSAKGSSHGSAKLNEVLIKQIRREAKTQSTRSLARKYNVGQTAIQQAIRGKTWKHVGEVRS